MPLTQIAHFYLYPLNYEKTLHQIIFWQNNKGPGHSSVMSHHFEEITATHNFESLRCVLGLINLSAINGGSVMCKRIGSKNLYHVVMTSNSLLHFEKVYHDETKKYPMNSSENISSHYFHGTFQVSLTNGSLFLFKLYGTENHEALKYSQKNIIEIFLFLLQKHNATASDFKACRLDLQDIYSDNEIKDITSIWS